MMEAFSWAWRKAFSVIQGHLSASWQGRGIDLRLGQ